MAQTTYADSYTKAFAGMLADGTDAVIESAQSAEASAEIRFGVAVEYGLERQATLPEAQTDKVHGIVLFSHAYSKGTLGELGDTGLKPNAAMSILRRGKVWVTCPTGCAIGDRLFVRAVAAGLEFLGACENAADSTDMVDCTKQGVFRTAASAGGLAVLEVDFVSEPD